MKTALALLSLLLVPTVALAADGPESDARKVAEAYLNSLTGEGEEAGRELLLGGATLNAQLFILENWKIASTDPFRSEEGDLSKATTLMTALDKAGRVALAGLVQVQEGADDLTMTEVSEADAAKLMAPTKAAAGRFSKQFPVFAYVARVGKEVYWHPKNPMRPLLAKAGASGNYTLELYRFKIETVEGPRKVTRKWPLRVLRFRAGKLDTGWRVMPASDWNGE